MKDRTAVRVTLAMMPIAGLSATAFADDFTAYEGKNTILEGNGAEKTTVDGVVFWSNGAPPRKFKLLGYIEDARLKSDLIRTLRMSGLQSTIAKETKKAAGDAAILVDANAETTGSVGSSNTSAQASATSYGNAATAQGHSFTTGASAAVKKQHTRYEVVKYLEGDRATGGIDASRPHHRKRKVSWPGTTFAVREAMLGKWPQG